MSTALTVLSLKASYTSITLKIFAVNENQLINRSKSRVLIISYHVVTSSSNITRSYMAILVLYVGFCSNLLPFLNSTLQSHMPILIGLIEIYTTNLRTHKFIPDSAKQLKLSSL
ncbi:hypothetical protein RhiirA4_476740 [Rhizophagus irregularis]|uniref:Uncharacterized protein n=1 Tax=Rhizophagus irregularis TaxID=588596 RepID=A0A2I1HC34_9GLOM|nr:hypothetical protein RhiirA4_476740 [Rhizophagus irregularis]